MDVDTEQKLVNIQPTKPKPKRIKKEQGTTPVQPMTPVPVKKPRKKSTETKPVSEVKPKTKLVKGSLEAKEFMSKLRAMKKPKIKS